MTQLFKAASINDKVFKGRFCLGLPFCKEYSYITYKKRGKFHVIVMSIAGPILYCVNSRARLKFIADSFKSAKIPFKIL